MSYHGTLITDFDEQDDATSCYSCGKLFLPPARPRSNRHEVLCPECNVDEDHAEAVDDDFLFEIIEHDHEVALRMARLRRVPASEVNYSAALREV